MPSDRDFFLSSSEHRDDWGRVRSCWISGKILDTEGKEYLWIMIDPPVIGQPYGLGGRDIVDVLLHPHFEGTSLFPISEFPLPVYIYRTLNEQVFKDHFASSENLTLVAWGEVFATRETAEKAIKL